MLVTGGTGLVGGDVIVALARRGVPVKALVRATSVADARDRLFARLAKTPGFAPELHERIVPVVGDTTQAMFGTSPLAIGEVGVVVHCAANTQFSARADDNVWQTNVSGARHLIDVVRSVNAGARVVFVSTASVVTAPENVCLSEDARFMGHENTYTRSKREAEAIVRASGLDVVVVRPSIVLSRGLQDRALARSILWAVPIMAELGEVPIDGDAHVDIVPVDHVARITATLALKPALAHAVYHISAGRTAYTFRQLLDAMVRQVPGLQRIRPVGRHARVTAVQRRLLRPLEAYLPFINADVRYANTRLQDEVGAAATPPPAVSYVPELVSYITVAEALEEMYVP
jgi:nucleoside-diphosphate-sugar epimerase